MQINPFNPQTVRKGDRYFEVNRIGYAEFIGTVSAINKEGFSVMVRKRRGLDQVDYSWERKHYETSPRVAYRKCKSGDSIAIGDVRTRLRLIKDDNFRLELTGVLRKVA